MGFARGNCVCESFADHFSVQSEIGNVLELANECDTLGDPAVFCQQSPPSFPEGDTWAFGFKLGEDFPLDPTGYQYQFSIVLKTTETEADDYQPIASYPNDFWGGGDLIFSLSNNSVGGDYQVGAVAGGGLSPVSTAARFFVADDLLILIVPASEIPDLQGMRATSFRHGGDWGMGGEWSGSVVPKLWSTYDLLGKAGFTFYF